MSEYNKRQWDIYIDGEPFIEVTDGKQFKMTFEVLHDFGGYTSYADVALYNLSAETANKAFKRGSELTLRAGYADSIDVIFSGTISNVLRERQGPSTITRLISRGTRLPSDQTQVNETLGKGVRVVDIIRACGFATNTPVVMDDTQFADIEPYVRGYTVDGDPRVIMDKLAKTHNFSYTFENGRLIVVRKGYAREGEVHVVSQFTGMEGIPEITETGVDVVVRLNPKIRIGGKYRLESDLATFNFSNLYFVDIPESAGQGEYEIFKVVHTGDTYGDAWSTKITGYRQNNT